MNTNRCPNPQCRADLDVWKEVFANDLDKGEHICLLYPRQVRGSKVLEQIISLLTNAMEDIASRNFRQAKIWQIIKSLQSQLEVDNDNPDKQKATANR